MKEKLEKQVYRIDEFCETHGIGRTSVYKEIAKKRLKTFKLGRMTLISRESAQNWLQLCQSESK